MATILPAGARSARGWAWCLGNTVPVARRGSGASRGQPALIADDPCHQEKSWGHTHQSNMCRARSWHLPDRAAGKIHIPRTSRKTHIRGTAPKIPSRATWKYFSVDRRILLAALNQTLQLPYVWQTPLVAAGKIHTDPSTQCHRPCKDRRGSITPAASPGLSFTALLPHQSSARIRYGTIARSKIDGIGIVRRQPILTGACRFRGNCQGKKKTTIKRTFHRTTPEIIFQRFSDLRRIIEHP